MLFEQIGFPRGLDGDGMWLIVVVRMDNYRTR